jgi:predicted metal-binding membrane protein
MAMLLAQVVQDGVRTVPFFGGGILLVWLVVGVLLLVFWLWALIDAIQNPRLNPNERILWVLVIILTSWIGAVIYLVVARRGRLPNVSPPT